MERIGSEGTAAIADRLAHELEAQSSAVPDAIGHRVVHGMLHAQPERVSGAPLAELRSIAPFDPEHLPREIELIEALQPPPSRHTASRVLRHGISSRHAPWATLADSAALCGQGRAALWLSWSVLHLSHAGTARRRSAASRGRVILAHLGSGASLAAVLDGHCIDTSMGSRRPRVW